MANGKPDCLRMPGQQSSLKKFHWGQTDWTLYGKSWINDFNILKGSDLVTHNTLIYDISSDFSNFDNLKINKLILYILYCY